MPNNTPLAMNPALAEHIAPRRDTFIEQGLWTSERLADKVAQHAVQRPTAEAVVDRKGRRRVSFLELDKLANRFAHWLIHADISEGDVIAVQLPNCLEAVVIAIGANKAGIAVAPMLTVYRENELRHNLGLTQAKAIFVPDTYRGFSHKNLAEQVSAQLDHHLRCVVVEVTDVHGDTVKQPGNPIKLSGFKDPSERRPAPTLDADRLTVLPDPPSGTKSSPEN